MTKYDGLIKKIYYDPAGFGTVQETYKEVKKLDSTIKVSDVKDWYERNIDRKNNLEDLIVILVKGLLMNLRLICLMCGISRKWRMVTAMVF